MRRTRLEISSELDGNLDDCSALRPTKSVGTFCGQLIKQVNEFVPDLQKTVSVTNEAARRAAPPLCCGCELSRPGCRAGLRSRSGRCLDCRADLHSCSSRLSQGQCALPTLRCPV